MGRRKPGVWFHPTRASVLWPWRRVRWTGPFGGDLDGHIIKIEHEIWGRVLIRALVWIDIEGLQMGILTMPFNEITVRAVKARPRAKNDGYPIVYLWRGHPMANTGGWQYIHVLERQVKEMR